MSPEAKAREEIDKKLEEAQNQLKSYYADCLKTFIANYNNKSFSRAHQS